MPGDANPSHILTMRAWQINDFRAGFDKALLLS